MDIIQVSSVLNAEGLAQPGLNVLVPNAENYKALLLQPHGDIEVTSQGVRNRKQGLADKQYKKFIEMACETQADLVMTPEYSMPWGSLIDAIKAGNRPEEGKIWALGCESIKYSELVEIKDDISDIANVIFESLDIEDNRFLSPLVYLFNSATVDENSIKKPVLLVQFKTHPMGDPDHYEINGLQKGNSVYQFVGAQGGIKLTSLICADVFAFEDSHAQEMYDRGLILHIQLNPKPRHEGFRGSRRRISQYSGDTTEVICLNWARNVCMEIEGEKQCWGNDSISAWYLKSTDYDQRDFVLSKNHKKGFYYTWYSSLRAHALFLNFDSAIFLLNATKIAHVNVAGAISRRRGPQLEIRHVWSDTDAAWEETDSADSGFDSIAKESATAEDSIKQVAEDNAINAERVLALCSGEINAGEDWYKANVIDACVINDSEIINRITFCQDTDSNACAFRTGRLKRLGNLWSILNSEDKLPPSLNAFKDNLKLDWSSSAPQQNILSEQGDRATVIYMGEEKSSDQIEKVKMKSSEYLRRSLSVEQERRSALQRLIVWYRDGNGEIKQFAPHQYIQIDEGIDASSFDIGREE